MDRPSPDFDDAHQQIQALLPWFVTGRLGQDEHAKVIDHLAACDACRDEVATERELHRQVERATIDMDLGWARMRDRIEGESVPARPWPRARRLMLSIVDRPRAAAMVITAQAALLVAAIAVPTLIDRPAPYHALGSVPASAAGNVIVMVRPDARVGDLARLLGKNGARIVDGPTSAGAYVLAVPQPQRTAIIASLRAQPAFAMAEPLDP
jgi:anti-sigma factor RsiW